MKEYIKDNGQMRLCSSNIAKMNVIEYMYYQRYWLWNNILDTIREFLECWSIIINMILILLFPIAYPIMAWLHIRNERKEMIEKYGKNWRKHLILIRYNDEI